VILELVLGGSARFERVHDPGAAVHVGFLLGRGRRVHADEIDLGDGLVFGIAVGTACDAQCTKDGRDGGSDGTNKHSETPAQDNAKGGSR